MIDPRWTITVLAVAAFALPSVARAHSAGGLDPHGCHSDRRSAVYHCHRGNYSGLKFNSKADMLRKKAEGYTGDDQRTAATDGDGGIVEKIWPFGRSDDEQPRAATGVGADVIVPKGLEQRLAVLKDLHSKELISDEEYAHKKREILGDL